MAECIDKRFELMLHSFEMGMLDEEDARKLLIHLYECESCFEKAKKFQNAAALLRSDQEIRKSLFDIESEQRGDAENSTGIVNGARSTAARNKIIRYALAAVVAIALIIPVYQFGIRHDTSADNIQQLYLTPLRGSGDNVIDLSGAQDVEIRFVVESAFPGTAVQIRVTRFDGGTIYVDEDFAEFNETGQGIFTLPLALFNDGHYVLTISDPTGDVLQSDVQYFFRAE